MTIPAWLKTKENGTVISIYVQPGARKSEIIGVHNERLKIKIKAPPVEGKANEEIVNFLADKLNLSKSSIVLLRGEKSREKDLLVNVPALAIVSLLQVKN